MTQITKEKPQLLILSGVPGSGKTTYACTLVKQNPNYIILNY